MMMIETRGLCKSFGDYVVLDGIDLDVAAGTIFALLGPNGAGKTTMVHILSTFIGADSGEARVAGHDLAREPDAVRAAIGTKRGKGWITLSPLPAQPEPKHLPRLKTEIIRRWGITGLLDMFKESALLTGCLDCFLSTGTRDALDYELLQKRLLLCIYGMGTNIGLKRLAGVDPNIDAEHLRYTRRRYLHKDHFRAAIAQVGARRPQHVPLIPRSSTPSIRIC